MIEQEKREAYLRAAGWTRSEIKSSGRFGSWDHLQYGDGLTARDALRQQLYNDADAAIDAMLRLPVLLDKIRAARRLWNSSQWCGPESDAAMDALFEEVTHG